MAESYAFLPCVPAIERFPPSPCSKHTGRAKSVTLREIQGAIPRSCARSSSIVVIAALKDNELSRLDAIDEAMFLIDASRPAAAELIPQRLGLADSGGWLTRRSLYEAVDPDQHLSVGIGPKHVVVPCVSGEANFSLHRIRARFRLRPLLA